MGLITRQIRLKSAFELSRNDLGDSLLIIKPVPMCIFDSPYHVMPFPSGGYSLEEFGIPISEKKSRLFGSLDPVNFLVNEFFF